MQGLAADDFPTLRSAETGSWLGQDHHGRGIGTEMRRAVLHLAVAHLGAHEVRSTAFVDNVASQRVSLAAGYEPDGRQVVRQRGRRAEQQRFVISRERWRATGTDLPVEVTGVAGGLALLGLA